MNKAALIILLGIHTTANGTYVTGSNQGTCETKTLVNHDKNFNPIGSVTTRVCWMKNAPIIYQEGINQGNIDSIMRAKAAYVTIDPPKNDKGEYIPFRGYFKATSDGIGKSLVYTSEVFHSNNYGKAEQKNNKVYKF